MRRLTLALSVVALATVVLGATSIGNAAIELVLPRGSVGTTQLRANAVTSIKVKDGTIVKADVKAGSLVAGPRGAAGAVGPAGAAGPAGPAGAQGTLGIVGYTMVSGSYPATGIIRSASATCPTGSLLTSIGGYATLTVPADRWGWTQSVNGADTSGSVLAYQYLAAGSGAWTGGGVIATCVTFG